MCLPGGEGFGACAGEVKPKLEVCGSPEDEDCNGFVACAGHLWSRGTGDTSFQSADDVAVDSAGNVVLVGRGGLSLFGVDSGVVGSFVAKLDPTGNVLWVKRFNEGIPIWSLSDSVAVDASGNITFAGSLWGTADLGAGPVTSTGTRDAFVVKLDPDGNHLWSKHFGGASSLTAPGGIAVDGQGNVLLTGQLSGSADFGGGARVSKANGDIFLVKLDAAGNHLWSKLFGDDGADAGWSVAADPAGNVLVRGRSWGSADFGGGPLSGAHLAKLDPAGNHLWSQTIQGDVPLELHHGLAVTGAGDVLITGAFTGSLSVGALSLAGPGDFDAYVVKLDPAGAPLWGKAFGGPAPDMIRAIQADSAGNALLLGDFRGTVNLGGGPLTAAGGDVFVIKLDAAGNHLWSKQYGDAADQAGTAVAAGPDGRVILAGNFYGTLDFGGAPLVSAGTPPLIGAHDDMPTYDVFVAELMP